MHHWIVAVKGTYALGEDGRLSLAEEQTPPLLVPEHHGEPGTSSLRYDADLGPMKPTTDILVLGSAYAPKERPTDQVEVRLKVGPIDKGLLVWGERLYEHGVTGVTPGLARPFLRQPIRYEYSYGGADLSDPDPRQQAFDLRNPVGRGVIGPDGDLVGRPAPQVTCPNRSDTPAGFGPIDRSWSPRVGFAGTYDEDWARTRRPLLPLDYDPRFALCAPVDQQPARHLRGGEVVELFNLTPGGRIRFELPKVYLTYTTRFGRRREEHRGRLVTVIIEPDAAMLQMVWQSALPVPAPDGDYLDVTTVREKPYLT